MQLPLPPPAPERAVPKWSIPKIRQRISIWCQVLAGASSLLRSRPSPARCRFRSPEWHRLVGTLLARIPEVNQECPRRFEEPPLRPLAPGDSHGYVAVLKKRSTKYTVSQIRLHSRGTRRSKARRIDALDATPYL
jgi:hypothetical protein